MNSIPQKLVFGLCEQFGLELDDKNRLAGGDDLGTMKQAREKLPREEFERLFWQGLSDGQIADTTGVAYHFVTRLKKEYGLTGIVGIGGRNTFTEKLAKEDKPMKEQENKAVENCTAKKMTIAEALKHRDFIVQELNCIQDVWAKINDSPPVFLTDRVRTMLETYHRGCQDEHERIDKAFQSTEIAI